MCSTGFDHLPRGEFSMDVRIAPQRVLLAKVGLDGHDRGIKVVARGLRDAGFHVIYSGLWQSPQSIAQAAQDEDVDWLGISILNGAHMTLVPQVLASMGDRALSNIGLIVGGIIPPADQEKLKQLGVVAYFGPGASIDTIVQFLASRSRHPKDIGQLVHVWKKEDRATLSRLLTLAAAGHDEELLKTALSDIPCSSAPVIALTGSGGVGKSSLLGEVVNHFDRRGERIGVLACDPESPVSGGALLGDRCRIAGTSVSERVFVRSLSTAAGEQGVAPNIATLTQLMKRFRFDRIFIETVGAGQSDVKIRSIADVVVLVLQPQTGDELQWEKAGILEVANIVVVNKSDLPGADQTAADVSSQLQSSIGPTIPVLKTSIARNEGIEEICHCLDSVSALAKGL
jgi:LAO/AO transport system ATPase